MKCRVLLTTLMLLTLSYATAHTLRRVAATDHLIGLYFSNKTIPTYHIFQLKNPQRFVVDLLDTRPSAPLMLAKNALIQGFRYHTDAEKTRLVFELATPFSYTTHATAGHLQCVISKSNPSKTATPPRLAVVVIDPGHGGKDPGATGPTGIHEKTVVLAIAKALQADLDHTGKIKTVLTRQGDYFVTLRGRLQLARKDKADLFMAIHADAYPDKNARGASIFALSSHGATSEAARWLAHNENNAVLGGAEFNEHSKDVRSVLLDLSQTATIADSLALGEDVKKALQKVTALHTGTVEQAPFVVLKSPDIPSLLIETGFISNQEEEKRLNSPNYQQKLAQALADGIEQYLYQHPPHGSIIETSSVSNTPS